MVSEERVIYLGTSGRCEHCIKFGEASRYLSLTSKVRHMVPMALSADLDPTCIQDGVGFAFIDLNRGPSEDR